MRWARGFEGQRRADLGNGTFLNPVFAGDHPDPSIIRDGDDYYLTFSSFDAYPGLVIWHSRDLINWQPVTAALKAPIGSVWAPGLAKHGGRFYCYIPARSPDLLDRVEQAVHRISRLYHRAACPLHQPVGLLGVIGGSSCHRGEFLDR